ncbi:hypothetical protein D3C72_2267720 [compost metagenome]
MNHYDNPSVNQSPLRRQLLILFGNLQVLNLTKMIAAPQRPKLAMGVLADFRRQHI